jgi:hypothetical protein
MSSKSIRSGAGSGPTWAAFLIGVPVGVGLLWAVHSGPLHHPLAERYLHHPVEKVELVLFCAAIAAVGFKLVSSLREKAALGATILPEWDGRALAPSQAGQLLEAHKDALHGWSGTWLGRRYLGVLDFVKSRGSANELDDHLRTLADADAMSHDASYSLVRLITWAIPILGFLGTVLGITDAITNVTPEQLENNIGSLTGGLSLAFDATALGLGLTMVLMFVTSLVERAEQAVLERVDAVAEAELGHRFSRAGAAADAGSERLLGTAESLVKRQAELWAQSLERVAVLGRDAAKEQHKQLSVSLEQALQTTLAKHTQRLADAETQMSVRQEKMLAAITHVAEILHATSQKQQQGLADLSQRLAQQTAALVQLQHGGGELTRLQEALAQNLNALAGAGAFEEAVQSLTAAIHLLTTRVAPAAKKAA